MGTSQPQAPTTAVSPPAEREAWKVVKSERTRIPSHFLIDLYKYKNILVACLVNILYIIEFVFYL